MQENSRLAMPFSQPFYVLAKPVGASCNLRCTYCYYLEKSAYYPNDTRHWMDDATLESFICAYIQSQPSPYVLFTWHGGEPLLRPLSFYNKVYELQQKYAGNRTIDNCIQTNGVLLNEGYCAFFKEHSWLVGLSIDGPEALHDACRVDAKGRPTFQAVSDAIHLLNRWEVQWNALVTVNAATVAHPLEIYHFLKDFGCTFIQLAPVVERKQSATTDDRLAAPNDYRSMRVTSESLLPGQWGQFLCALFDEWVQNDVGTVFIQHFDATLANWMGHPPGLCTFSRTCGQALAMEFNGDVYACDHYVFPEFLLGNLRTRSFMEMLLSPSQIRFGQNKRDSLPKQCLECDFLNICNGECPKNRFCFDVYGEPGLNYFCSDLKHFFTHTASWMQSYVERYGHLREQACRIR